MSETEPDTDDPQEPAREPTQPIPVEDRIQTLEAALLHTEEELKRTREELERRRRRDEFLPTLEQMLRSAAVVTAVFRDLSEQALKPYEESPDESHREYAAALRREALERIERGAQGSHPLILLAQLIAATTEEERRAIREGRLPPDVLEFLIMVMEKSSF